MVEKWTIMPYNISEKCFVVSCNSYLSCLRQNFEILDTLFSQRRAEDYIISMKVLYRCWCSNAFQVIIFYYCVMMLLVGRGEDFMSM